MEFLHGHRNYKLRFSGRLVPADLLDAIRLQ